MLAFFETPSSLSVSSDISLPKSFLTRYEFPCAVLESLDLFCLILFAIDACVKVSDPIRAFSEFLSFYLNAIDHLELFDRSKTTAELAMAHWLLNSHFYFDSRLRHFHVAQLCRGKVCLICAIQFEVNL